MSDFNTKNPDFANYFKIKYLKEGDNKNFPNPKNRVKVHYTGTIPTTGKKFDSSVDRNEPFIFTLKVGQVIRCWDEVVSRMSLGEKIYVVCPSDLAYGKRGAGSLIPPNSDIAFEIELLDFSGPKKI